MVLVAGSANLDFVVRASHIPAPGETVLGRAFQTFPGGKGANQAVACARSGGVATHMLGALSGGAGSPEEEMAKLAIPAVVVTRGAQGSLAWVNGWTLAQASPRITAVDTTGAGDTFCGTLVAALSDGRAMDDALHRASAAAAISCTRPGAQSSIPSRAELETFLQRS